MATFTRMAAGEISPKAIAAALVATVTPYLLTLLAQYDATGVIDAVDWRKLLVGLVTGAVTFLGAWLARPGHVVTEVHPDDVDAVYPDGPHI